MSPANSTLAPRAIFGLVDHFPFSEGWNPWRIRAPAQPDINLACLSLARIFMQGKLPVSF
jgi:hypothetical protein